MKRPIKKVFTVFLWIAAGMAVLLAGASLALRILFPPAKLRALAQEEICKHLHREAQIGPVGLGVFGGTLERLRLSNVPDFSAGTFLYVEKAALHWSLLPLLQRKTRIDLIVLDQAQVNL